MNITYSSDTPIIPDLINVLLELLNVSTQMKNRIEVSCGIIFKLFIVKSWGHMPPLDTLNIKKN